MQRPNPNEYAPFFQKYLGLVGEGDFFDLIDANTALMVGFFKNIDPSKHDYRYAKGKWTIKDLFLHIIDTERGFSYRAIVCVCVHALVLYRYLKRMQMLNLRFSVTEQGIKSRHARLVISVSAMRCIM